MSCLDGNFLSNSVLSKYLNSKIDPGSEIDFLIDMCDGTIQFLINGEYKGVALESEDLKNASVYLTIGIADFGDSIEIVKPEGAGKVQEYVPYEDIIRQLEVDNDEFLDLIRNL